MGNITKGMITRQATSDYWGYFASISFFYFMLRKKLKIIIR